MLKTDKIEILTSLGYRKKETDTYVKPFGFNLFCYNLQTDYIENYFTNSKLMVFESKSFLGTDFTLFVKMFEQSAYLSVENELNFGFLTMAERIECLL